MNVKKELKMEKLTCAQAKQIDLVLLLDTLGYRPEKIKNDDYWYSSPLREERTPSFKVNRKLNVWYDHASGLGGKIIDFGLLYFNCSINNLLERLAALNTASTLSFHPPVAPSLSAGEKKNPYYGKILITEVRPLADKSLIEFLDSRRIDVAIAKQFCREVDFSLYGKEHTAIGFINRSGGYELRSDYFKGSSAPKDITLIENNPGKKRISVLEGATDFLSLFTLRPELQTGNFLVLNSLSFVNKSLEILRDFKEVWLYLDHDTAGRKATEEIKRSMYHASDHSQFYSQHKDLNDYLTSQKLTEQASQSQAVNDHNRQNQDHKKNLQTPQNEPPNQYRRKI